MANAHRIAQDVGVRLVSPKRHGHPGGARLPPRTCYSRKTIRLIAEAGERAGHPDHAHDVLGLVLAADDGMLFGDVIKGVSRWALRWNLSTGKVGHILPAFRAIDIYNVRQAVLHHRIDVRDVQIAFLVSGLMEPCMRRLARA